MPPLVCLAFLRLVLFGSFALPFYYSVCSVATTALHICRFYVSRDSCSLLSNSELLVRPASHSVVRQCLDRGSHAHVLLSTHPLARLLHAFIFHLAQIKP